MTGDSFDLDRFVQAQADSYACALAELRAGRKRSHWVWFVFPQLQGLGRSPMAQHYGLSGLAEARAYAAHPVLGPRLREATRLMITHAGRSARDILGTPDDMKFHSSMTLFRQAAEDPADAALFQQALDAFFGGDLDRQSLQILSG